MPSVAAASLNVLVDVQSKKAVQQLSAFDTHLKRTAKTAALQTGSIDKASVSTASYGKVIATTTESTKNLATETKKLGTETKRSRAETDRIESGLRKGAVAMGHFSVKAAEATDRGVDFRKTWSLVKIPAMAAAAGQAASALSAAAGGAAALTGALQPLIGLSAGLGSLVGIMAQIKGTLAVSGIKEVTAAVGGLNEQLDKTADAYKQLTPEGQKFARTLNQMKQPLQEMQEAVQQPLFRGMTEGLKEIRPALDTVQGILRGTGKELGNLAAMAGRTFGSEGAMRDLERFGRANNDVIGRMGETLIKVTRALLGASVAARPLTRWMSKLAQSWGENFAAMLNTGRKSGSLTKFFERTREVASDLIAIFRNVGGALGNIIKAGAPLGRDIIDRLRAGARHLREWTESTKGKHSIAEYFASIKKPLMEVGKLFSDVLHAFFEISEGSMGTMTETLHIVRKELLPVFTHFIEVTSETFGPRFTKLLANIVHHFLELAGTNRVLDLWVESMIKVTDVLNWLITNVPGLKEVVLTMMGFRAVSRIMDFSGWVTGIKPAVTWLRTLGTTATQTRGQIIAMAAIEKVKGAMFALGNSMVVLRVRMLAMAAAEKVVAAMAAVGRAVMALSFTVRGAMLATGIGALIVAAGLIITHWEEVKVALAAVWEWIKQAAADVAEWIKEHWKIVAVAFGPVGIAIALLIKNFGKIKDAVVAAGKWIIGALKKVWEFIKALPGRIANALKTLFRILTTPYRLAFEFIRSIPGKIWGLIKKIPGLVGRALSGLFRIFVRGFNTALNWVKELPGKIFDFVKRVPGMIGDALKGLFAALTAPFRPVFDWIADKIDFIVGKFEDLKSTVDDVTGFLDPFGGGGPNITDIGAKGGYVTEKGIEGFGGPVAYFAGGGKVGATPKGKGGPKGKGTDTVPAFLTPGEIVLSVEAVKKLKDEAQRAVGSADLKGPDARQLLDETKRGAKAIGTELHRNQMEQERKTGQFRKSVWKHYRQMGSDVKREVKQMGRLSVQEFTQARTRALKQSGQLRRGAGEDFKKLQRESGKQFDSLEKNASSKMAKTANAVTGITAGMVNTASGMDGMELLVANTNKALESFGVAKKVEFTAVQAKPRQEGAQAAQRGAVMVPGVGTGDRVHAMLEPGEVVLNRKAVAAMGGADRANAINKAIPRFQQGGEAGGGGGGGNSNAGAMGAMIALTEKYEAASYPYLWGGGHGGFVNGMSPVDCSGFVSDVLHAGGLLDGAPMVSGALASWGQPASGNEPLVVYANDGHTLMSLNGKFAGTSASNPQGGAGYISTPSGGYLGSFAKRTMDVVGGVVEALKKITMEGPAGPLLEMGQAALDKVRAAGDKKIEANAPAGTIGGGDPANIDDLPQSLQQYNKNWPSASIDDMAAWSALPQMPFQKVAMLAEWAGMPGITFAQISKGEGNLRPGSVGPASDPGVGLWAITPPFGDGKSYPGGSLSGDYRPEMNNPILNAIVASQFFDERGTDPWYGTGYVTDWNAHFTGPIKQRGGIIARMQEGGLIPNFNQMIEDMGQAPGEKRDKGKEARAKLMNKIAKINPSRWVAADTLSGSGLVGKLDEAYVNAENFGLFSGYAAEKDKEHGYEIEKIAGKWQILDADGAPVFTGLTEQATLDEYQKLIEPFYGEFHGKTEVEWLTKQLKSLHRLRELVVQAKKKSDKRRKQMYQLWKRGTHQLDRVWQPKLNEIERALGKKGKLAKDLSKGPEPMKGSIEEWNKQEQNKRVNRMKEFENKGGKLPGNRVFDTGNGKLFGLEKSPGRFPDPGKPTRIIDGLKAVVPALENGYKGFETASASLFATLVGLQGTTPPAPTGRLRELPKIDSQKELGGSIREAQVRLLELGQSPTISAGETLTGDDAGQMTIADLLEIAEAVRLGAFGPVLNQPWLGPFAKGGVALVGEQGPELVGLPHGTRVQTADETRSAIRPTVEIHFASGMEWLDQFMEVKVDGVIQRREDKDRNRYRAGRRL